MALLPSVSLFPLFVNYRIVVSGFYAEFMRGKAILRNGSATATMKIMERSFQALTKCFCQL